MFNHDAPLTYSRESPCSEMNNLDNVFHHWITTLGFNPPRRVYRGNYRFALLRSHLHMSKRPHKYDAEGHERGARVC